MMKNLITVTNLEGWIRGQTRKLETIYYAGSRFASLARTIIQHTVNREIAAQDDDKNSEKIEFADQVGE